MQQAVNIFRIQTAVAHRPGYWDAICEQQPLRSPNVDASRKYIFLMDQYATSFTLAQDK